MSSETNIRVCAQSPPNSQVYRKALSIATECSQNDNERTVAILAWLVLMTDSDGVTFAGSADVAGWAGQEREGQLSEAGVASSSGRGMEAWGLEPHGNATLPQWLAEQPCLLWLRARTGQCQLCCVVPLEQNPSDACIFDPAYVCGRDTAPPSQT